MCPTGEHFFLFLLKIKKCIDFFFERQEERETPICCCIFKLLFLIYGFIARERKVERERKKNPFVVLITYSFTG